MPYGNFMNWGVAKMRSSVTREEIKRLYAVLRSELNNLSVQNIRNTAAAAGIDVTQITAKAEARSGLGSRAEVMPAIDRLFGEMPTDKQETALRILAERLVTSSPELASNVQEILGSHGYQFIEGAFIPVGMLDARESQFLPTSSASEIARATARLLTEDYSGAITAACGAVDLLTQEVYKKHNLGDPGKVAFQAKVNTCLKQLSVFEQMHKDFVGLGVSEADALSLVDHMRQATNQAAHALQILRRAMGDTHGSKPALRATAYDSIKWASAICGLLESRMKMQSG
jgi:hypothetical protein